MATRSCCSTPRTAVAGGRSATSAPAPCRSTKRSSASATIHTSWNCARLTIEPRQRIDTQSEGRSLETTGERYKGAIKTLHGPDKRDRSDDLDVAACAIGHHADAEMALGALLAAAEWHADSGADVFGHLVKRNCSP